MARCIAVVRPQASIRSSCSRVTASSLPCRRSRGAQEPSAPQAVSPAQLQAAIDKLGDLDYATRTDASRTVRRTPAAQAVPALLQAVAEHADGYVRIARSCC